MPESARLTKPLGSTGTKFILCFKVHIHKVLMFRTVIFLSEVLYSAFKYALIFFSDYVDSNIFTNSLRVAHLAKHPAVRTDYAFNCIVRAIWIESTIHGHIAFYIRILEGNLSICGQILKPLLICHKSPCDAGME